MKPKKNNRKNLFRSLAFGAFILGNVYSCTIPPAVIPEIKEAKREPLEYRLDIERESQSYALELKGDVSVKNLPRAYKDGKGGSIMQINSKRENEYLNIMVEIYEDKTEIYDSILKKKRKTGTNCYAEEINLVNPEFEMTANKSCRIINNKKVFSEWYHVYGDVCDKQVTVIDTDGDRNPDSVSFDNKRIEINPGRKIIGFEKLPPEENGEMIEQSINLYNKARKYFSENVGSFEKINF